MDSEEYRRLQEAFIALAGQFDAPDVRARWVALAQASSNLAKDPLKVRPWNQQEEESARANTVLKLARTWVSLPDRT